MNKRIRKKRFRLKMKRYVNDLIKYNNTVHPPKFIFPEDISERIKLEAMTIGDVYVYKMPYREALKLLAGENINKTKEDLNL